MYSQGFHGPRTVPGSGYRHLAPSRSYANVFCGKAQDPGFITFLQSSTCVALKTDHRPPLGIKMVKQFAGVDLVRRCSAMENNSGRQSYLGWSFRQLTA